MRWPEIGETLTRPHIVILPVGSTEQHGRHLPVNFDTYSVVYYAEKVAERVGSEHDIRVLVAPAVAYGDAHGSPPFKKQMPGTISISPETLTSLVEDVVKSLVMQGFKNILVLNGHVENAHAIAVGLRKVNIEFPEAGLFATSSFALGADKWPDLMRGTIADQGHAGESETAVALAIEPQNVKCDEIYEGSRVHALPPKYLTPLGREGVFYCSRVGGVRDSGLHVKNPCIASKGAGEKIIEAVVESLIEIVLAIARSEDLKHEERPLT